MWMILVLRCYFGSISSYPISSRYTVGINMMIEVTSFAGVIFCKPVKSYQINF